MRESKEERFVRLAEARVNKALDQIRLIGNLANTHTYAYTEDQVEKIFAVLAENLDMARDMFRSSVSDNKRFTLMEEIEDTVEDDDDSI